MGRQASLILLRNRNLRHKKLFKVNLTNYKTRVEGVEIRKFIVCDKDSIPLKKIEVYYVFYFFYKQFFLVNYPLITL